MSKTTISAVFAFVALGAATVVGVNAVGADDSAPTVTTILGFVGLAVTQLLGNRATEEVRDDLRNGRVEKLLRDALERVANDDSTRLEITRRESDDNGR